MLRRDLLKGLLGLIGGGLLLKDLPPKEPEYAAYTIPNCSKVPDHNIIGIFCRNEFRMECQEEVEPGDKLYYHLSNRGKISKEPNDCFVGVAMSNKDEWGCCQVALYLS